MLWHEADGAWTTQQARWLSDPTEGAPSRFRWPWRLWEAMYCGQMLRDVGHLFPHGHGEIAAVGDSERVAQVIREALTRDRHYGNPDMGDAVREFCDRCAPRVVAAGQAAFEVIFSKPNRDSPAPATFYLMHVQNYRKHFGRHMQYQPGRGWKRLDAGQLVVFKMDKARRTAVRHALLSLEAASRHQNALDKMLGSRPPGYDFKTHQKIEAIAINRATRALGWNHSPFVEHLREPYQIHRWLTWYAFRMDLRELVIDGLNRALRIAGDAMGFDVRLEVRGLPTREDIDDARKRLEDGQCGRLFELIEPFLKKA